MKNIFLLTIFLLSFSTSLFSQNRHYVDKGATGANNGQSWFDAFTDLQSALQLAQPGDAVWVAEGVYYPTDSNDRTVSFALASGVQLYGGFSGNENDLSQREWAAYPTILSGDIGVTDDSTDNSVNVVYLFQPDSNTVLDGFTISHGQADNVNLASTAIDRMICGGGLYMDAGNWDAFATIRNCRFWHNTAYSSGGGVLLTGSINSSVAPRFVNCAFEENRSLSSGGGVARFGGSWTERGAEFESCYFSYNKSAQFGGGLLYNDTKGVNKITIYNCIFEYNTALLQGGGAFFETGKPGKSGLYLQKNVFKANSADEGIALSVFSSGNNFDG